MKYKIVNYMEPDLVMYVKVAETEEALENAPALGISLVSIANITELEKAIMQAYERSLPVRTSAVFSEEVEQFVKTYVNNVLDITEVPISSEQLP